MGFNLDKYAAIFNVLIQSERVNRANDEARLVENQVAHQPRKTSKKTPKKQNKGG